jgi:hypothetical protein
MAEQLPITVPYEDVKAALAALGIPTERLMDVQIAPKAITVTYRRVDDQGRSVAAGDELATVVTTIGVDRGERA